MQLIFEDGWAQPSSDAHHLLNRFGPKFQGFCVPVRGVLRESLSAGSWRKINAAGFSFRSYAHVLEVDCAVRPHAPTAQ